jgi:hypothetical protein
MPDDPLRINLVLGQQIPFPPVRGGGVNNLVWMLAKQFAAMGHTVRAYSPLAPGLPAHETDAFGIEHFRVEGKPTHANVWIDNLQSFPYSLQVWPLLKPADVTSFHTTFSFFLRLKPTLGVCTHTLHRTPKWILQFHRWQDRIYAGSHAVVEQAKTIAPQLAPKLKAIHNCIELPQTMPATTLHEPLTFLYVGRFVPDKGLESLIRGFLAVAPENPAMRLRIIGPQTSNEGADEEFFARMKDVIAADASASQVSLEPSCSSRSSARRCFAFRRSPAKRSAWLRSKRWHPRRRCSCRISDPWARWSITAATAISRRPATLPHGRTRFGGSCTTNSRSQRWGSDRLRKRATAFQSKRLRRNTSTISGC